MIDDKSNSPDFDKNVDLLQMKKKGLNVKTTGMNNENLFEGLRLEKSVSITDNVDRKKINAFELINMYLGQ